MVVTDAGGNGEAVQDGVTGIVVPPNDPVKMAEALFYLACNPSIREKFALAAIKRINSEFSIDACVNNYDSLYREIILNNRHYQKIELKTE
jgi:glycosyltransferase involved in cell wall biosynthesis